jgi:hypothetical protein
MRYLLALILIIHGLIHLLGFAKAFGHAELPQITEHISKSLGLLWLFTTLIFLLSAISFILDKNLWWTSGLIAMVLSQMLIFLTWESSKFGSIANIIILLSCLVGYATYHFKDLYHHDILQMLTNDTELSEETLTDRDLEDLPLPVQKYIRLSGSIGKPKVRNFKIIFHGKIRKNREGPWMEFISEQYNSIDQNKRLFFMDAVMHKMPVSGYHQFQNGKASMDIRLFSFLTVQKQEGSEMDISETVTFFQDMCGMVPASLIDPRISWPKTEGNRVLAEFKMNDRTISAWLHFNEKGELIDFVSEDRYAYQDDGTLKRFRWSTPLNRYREVNGHHLATYAEAIYRYPEGDFCYGIFELKSVEINLTRGPVTGSG